jgi:CDP-paratose 2-epimerase
MKVLITGIAGFVGTNLARRLLAEGNKVMGVDSLHRKGSELNLAGLKEEFGDLYFRQREIEDVPDVIIKEKPEVVYHFAAQVAVTSSLENPRRDFKINAEGTFNVANAALSIRAPVVYTSTNKVYGDNVNAVPIVEHETRYDFGGKLSKKGIAESFSIDSSHHTPYGVSKLVGDLYVREFRGVVNRCSCMYGPNQHGIVDQGWLSHIAQRAIKGEEVTIYGDGKQVRDVLHANDVVSLLASQGEALVQGEPDIRGEVFNVGGGYGNTISLLELCSRWGIEEPRFEDWRPADQKVFYCDVSKAKRVLDWKPEVNLEEGLRNLYEWTEKSLST